VKLVDHLGNKVHLWTTVPLCLYEVGWQSFQVIVDQQEVLIWYRNKWLRMNIAGRAYKAYIDQRLKLQRPGATWITVRGSQK